MSVRKSWTMELGHRQPERQPWCMTLGAHDQRFAVLPPGLGDDYPPFLNFPGPWWPHQYYGHQDPRSLATVAELATLPNPNLPHDQGLLMPDLQHLEVRLRLRGFAWAAAGGLLHLGVRCRFQGLNQDLLLTHPLATQPSAQWQDITGHYGLAQSQDWQCQGYCEKPGGELPEWSLIRSHILLVSSLSLVIAPLAIQPLQPELLAQPPAINDLLQARWPINERTLPQGSLGMAACAIDYTTMIG